MAGEVHYFRVAREEWEQRILLLKEAGCSAVASYIPWLWHELPDGTIDVTGRDPPRAGRRGLHRPVRRARPVVHRAAGAVHHGRAQERGTALPHLHRAPRGRAVRLGRPPGPEPHASTTSPRPSWRSARRGSPRCCPLIAAAAAAQRRQRHRGAARQRDRHAGVGHQQPRPHRPPRRGLRPVGARALRRRRSLPARRRRRSARRRRSGRVRCARTSPCSCATGSGATSRRCGRWPRRRGCATCRSSSTSTAPRVAAASRSPSGSASSSRPMPASRACCRGSDHYMGDMTLNTTTDLYVINAFMDAVHGPGQPTTSLEFEAGSGDYGGGVDNQYDPSTVDLKTRRSLAQGNRMVNYYLFAGGINPPLEETVGDGNDRISFTGERHGTAAPVGPEGQRGHDVCRDLPHRPRRPAARALAGAHGGGARPGAAGPRARRLRHGVPPPVERGDERGRRGPPAPPRCRAAPCPGALDAARRLPVRGGPPPARRAQRGRGAVQRPAPRARGAAGPRRPRDPGRWAAAARPPARARPRGPALHHPRRRHGRHRRGRHLGPGPLLPVRGGARVGRAVAGDPGGLVPAAPARARRGGADRRRRRGLRRRRRGRCRSRGPAGGRAAVGRGALRAGAAPAGRRAGPASSSPTCRASSRRPRPRPAASGCCTSPTSPATTRPSGSPSTAGRSAPATARCGSRRGPVPSSRWASTPRSGGSSGPTPSSPPSRTTAWRSGRPSATARSSSSGADGDLAVDGGEVQRDGDTLTVTAPAGVPVVLRRA